MASGSASPPSEKSPDPRLTVGTLTYTKMGLIALFIWLLWGSFCFSLMEALIPSLLPLQLKQLRASNALIGILVGSIPSAINFFVNPVVSFRSDRTRTRIGRRRPYLIFATPFVSLFLIAVGWAPIVAQRIHTAFSPNFSPVLLALILVAILAVAFQFFNMFVASVFYYIFADVVPEAYMGRFMGYFGVIGAAAGFVFNRYVLGLADTHMPWIYTGIAVLYFVSFMLMSWRVKEGEYPPPTNDAERKGVLASVKVYFRECFSNSFYLWFFLATALNAVSMVCRALFNVFFAKENLHMTLDQYGKIMGWRGLFQMALYVPLGYLVDKFRPLRVYIAGVTLVIFTNVFGFFLIHSSRTFFVFTMLLALVYAIQMSSNLPMYAALLPKERWGQFCSAQAMFQAVFLIIFNYGGGLFIDWVGNYRYLYLWDAMFTIAAWFATLQVYRGWRRYGGPSAYVAPLT